VSGCPSGSVCAGFLVKRLKPAVGFAPAMGLPEQSSAGTFSWTNANAGAAVATSISAATDATVTSKMMRFIGATSFIKAELVSPAVLQNGCTILLVSGDVCAAKHQH
jgi:hypothetical protein